MFACNFLSQETSFVGTVPPRREKGRARSRMGENGKVKGKEEKEEEARDKSTILTFSLKLHPWKKKKIKLLSRVSKSTHLYFLPMKNRS